MDNNNLNNLSLGSGKIKQISIAEKIDQRKIEEILLDNIFFFKKFLKEKADKYGQEILDTLIKDKKLKSNLKILSNSNKLQFKDNFFDNIICLSVFSQLKNKKNEKNS